MKEIGLKQQKINHLTGVTKGFLCYSTVSRILRLIVLSSKSLLPNRYEQRDHNHILSCIKMNLLSEQGNEKISRLHYIGLYGLVNSYRLEAENIYKQVLLLH